jgi:hypothetical protein
MVDGCLPAVLIYRLFFIELSRLLLAGAVQVVFFLLELFRLLLEDFF